MNKKYIILLIAVVVVVGVIGVWFGLMIKSSQSVQLSPYSMVYLSTGDVYFGKLDMFPWPTITDVWMLQKNSNGQPSIVPLKNLPYGLNDEIRLNPQEIVWWSRLTADSQFAQALANPGALNSAPQSTSTPSAPPVAK
ncbi:hypothetical protein M1513_01670 [Patescibacteria group bacterium]|nr:hypothetical protein [Patescibacteria group bacterium]MCL5733319.1 hypothetical protein [Patescibacteria group bacterium]